MAGADHPFSCLLLFQPLSKGRYRYIKDGGRGEELQYGMASFDLSQTTSACSEQRDSLDRKSFQLHTNRIIHTQIGNVGYDEYRILN